MNKHTATFTVVAMLGLSAPASAYVRTRTTAGVPTAWRNPCVTMELALGGPPEYLDATSYLEAAQQGAAAWTQASLDGAARCSNVVMGVNPTTDVAGLIGKDDHNRIIFRQNEWCRDPPPTDPSEPRCYDGSALAITTVFQLKNSGEILDADIEVNAVNFKWGDFVGRSEFMSYGTHDFQGAITHELGHVLGLEHTCYIPRWYKDGTPVPRPVDHTGALIPDCEANNSAVIADATMYVSVNSPATEVEMRSLSPDDMQGVCDIYPFSPTFVCGAPGLDPNTSGKGGCSLATHREPGSVALALALAGLALHLRRRRGRRG